MGKKIESTYSSNEIREIQKNISTYLRSYRKINEMTRYELIEDLGCSMATLEKYESPLNPSPIANYIAGLKPIADLRELDLDVFVSAMIGKKNKQNQSNAFIDKTSESIASFSAPTQYKIHELLQLSENDINDVLDLRTGLISHPRRIRKIIKDFLSKKGKWFESVLNIMVGQ